MRYFSFFICLLFYFSSQGQIKFYAKTDANKILENSYLNLEFILENGKGKKFMAPAFKNFNISGGPSKSNSISIVNGKRSVSQSFSYELSPTKTGKLRIPSASITVDGKRYFTDPIVIQVIKASKTTVQQNTDPFYVKIRLSDSIAYIGQQVILDYVLFTKVDVRAHNLQDRPEYTGFFAEEISRRRSSYSREIIDGEEYYVKVIDRIALFPQQTGNYSFGPYQYRIGVNKGKARSNFFFNQQLKYYNTSTNVLSIQIQDFKEIPPKSFSGAVGAYSMRVNQDKTSIDTDDAFTIHMRIDGDGDSRTVNAPNQNFGNNLDIYDPNVILDENNLSNNKITNSKLFEYIIVPKKAGQYDFQAEFSYYNPDSSKFITLRSDSMYLSVAQGTGVSRIKEDTKISKIELASISDQVKLQALKKPFFNSKFYWLFYMFALMGVIYILWLKKRQIEENSIDPLDRKANLANLVATSRLAKVDEHIANDEIKEAFAEISNSLKAYLSDKFQVAYSELNEQSILKLLIDLKIDTKQIDQTKNSFSICEMAIYASAQAGSVKEVRDQISSLISSIETK